MFYKHSRICKTVVLIVYVDYMVIIGNDTIEIENLNSKLMGVFEFKNLGVLKCFLGMEFARSNEGIFDN